VSAAAGWAVGHAGSSPASRGSLASRASSIGCSGHLAAGRGPRAWDLPPRPSRSRVPPARAPGRRAPPRAVCGTGPGLAGEGAPGGRAGAAHARGPGRAVVVVQLVDVVQRRAVGCRRRGPGRAPGAARSRRRGPGGRGRAAACCSWATLSVCAGGRCGVDEVLVDGRCAIRVRPWFELSHRGRLGCVRGRRRGLVRGGGLVGRISCVAVRGAVDRTGGGHGQLVPAAPSRPRTRSRGRRRRGGRRSRSRHPHARGCRRTARRPR
jgi:hypothetical protein